MTIRAILITVAATALVLAGCGTTGATNDSPPNGSNGDKAAASTKKSEKPKEENPTFGQSYTWEDGITVTISKPSDFKPGQYAAASKSPAYVKFSVRIVNKSGKNFDPVLFNATLQSGNEEAEQVFDSENKIGETPTTALLDGREAKFTIGFGVKDKSDLVLQVAPGFEYNSVIFTN